MTLLAGCTSKSSHKSKIETPEEISAVLNGYKITGVGDSLMTGYGGNDGSFCEYLQNDYGVDSKRYAVNVASWSPIETSVYSYKKQLTKLEKEIKEGKEYNILLLEGGMNTIERLKDTNKEVTKPSEIIGSMDELNDLNKVSGLVEDNVSVAYDYFKALGRYIFYIFPAVPKTFQNDNYRAYKNFMINYCNAKDIVIIDLSKAGMKDNSDYYSIGVHYTDKGYKLTSDYVAKVIAQTIVSYKDKK
jgi:hypothetical protein